MSFSSADILREAQLYVATMSLPIDLVVMDADKLCGMTLELALAFGWDRAAAARLLAKVNGMKARVGSPLAPPAANPAGPGPGSEVKLHGLSRGDLNGRTGVAVALVAETDRCRVALHGTWKLVDIKRENLRAGEATSTAQSPAAMAAVAATAAAAAAAAATDVPLEDDLEVIKTESLDDRLSRLQSGAIDLVEAESPAKASQAASPAASSAASSGAKILVGSRVFVAAWGPCFVYTAESLPARPRALVSLTDLTGEHEDAQAPLASLRLAGSSGGTGGGRTAAHVKTEVASCKAAPVALAADSKKRKQQQSVEDSFSSTDDDEDEDAEVNDEDDDDDDDDDDEKEDEINDILSDEEPSAKRRRSGVASRGASRGKAASGDGATMEAAMDDDDIPVAPGPRVGRDDGDSDGDGDYAGGSGGGGSGGDGGSGGIDGDGGCGGCDKLAEIKDRIGKMLERACTRRRRRPRWRRP